MSDRTRVITISPPRRSTIGGGYRRALPVCVAAAVLALFGAGAALAQSANTKFCGFTFKPLPRGGWDIDGGLRNLAPTHKAISDIRGFNGYSRRAGYFNGYNGFVFWGYSVKNGFTPLYFVPGNVPPEEC